MIFVPWVLQSGAAFNLVCSIAGTMGLLDPNGNLTQTTDRTYTRVFRVDFAAGWWCADDCKEISRIVRATRAEVVLQQTKTADIDAFMRVDLETGTYSSHLKTSRASSSGTGTCQFARFTRFSAR